MNISEMTPQERFVFMGLQMQCGIPNPDLKDTEQIKSILTSSKDQTVESLQEKISNIDQMLSQIENLEQGLWR